MFTFDAPSRRESASAPISVLPRWRHAHAPRPTFAARDHQSPIVGDGEPLSSGARRYFEPRFCQDFSNVRVHTNAAADRAASAIGARAYTHDNDIVFASGRYTPDTPSGRRLIGHELAHVVQQCAGAEARTRDPQARATLSEPTDAFEREADDSAWAMENGGPEGSTVANAAPLSRVGNVVQREAASGGGSTSEPTEHLAGTLYAAGPDGRPLPPSLDDLRQGALNDCFLFAAMAAIVNTEPKRIVNMIAYGPNHTYTVIFKGIGFLSSAKQTVSADFVKGKRGNVAARGALWPLVIEKAYAQEKGGLAELDKGGNAGSAIDDMLNDSASSFDPREKTVDYIMGKIAKAKEKKWPMTILSPQEKDATKEKREMADSGGLHFWHTYAIIDVDAKNNRIKLFNPWGNSHPHGDGWISVSDVRKFFIQIDIND